MAKTDFSWVNAVDLATFAAGNQAASLPASNLAIARQGTIWRSLAIASYFVATYDAVYPVDILALSIGQAFDSRRKKWFGTLAATDQIRHQLFDAGGATLLDVTVSAGCLDGYGLHTYRLANTVNAASWRCDITATSRAAQGYFDISRAWSGPVWRPGIGIAYPWDEAWQDGANNTRGKLSGARFTGDGPKYRTVNVLLDFMSDADKLQAKEMMRVVGTRGQLLVVPDQDGNPPSEAILGILDKLQPITCSQDIVPPVYSQSFSLTQDL